MEIVEPMDISKRRGGQVILDVRTPAEYAQGHIPGAQNLPLLSNEERARVGTTYKQVNPQEAFLEALEFVGPKLKTYVKTAHKLAGKKRVLVHCWRGGQRSGGMAWLLAQAGFEVSLLRGGYKNYRRYCREDLMDRDWKLVVIGGPTGCGKTEMLWKLKDHGEQIIDLEGLARHKGSAFGGLGQPDQPTNEQFENDLYYELESLNPQKNIWIENESHSIGRVYIPEGFFEKMKKSAMVHIELPINDRVDRLVQEYGSCDLDELAESFSKITKRLGGQHAQAAVGYLHENQLGKACEIALKYYDKAYEKSTARHNFKTEIPFRLTREITPQTIVDLLKCTEENGI